MHACMHACMHRERERENGIIPVVQKGDHREGLKETQNK